MKEITNHEKWKLRFFTIWSGQAISILSSAVLQMALIWHLTATTRSAMVLSMASIAAFLPSAVLGSFAGALVDRWNRKAVMVGADIFIALVSLILVVYALFSELPIWLIMLILSIRSVGAAFHSPALSAVTPLIVPESQLTKCAGYSQSVQTLGFIAGTAIAGVIYPIWSISAIVAIDVAGAVFACLTVAFVHIPEPIKDVKQERTHILSEMKDGYNVIRENRGLFALLWIGAVFMLIYSPINALFPLICMEYFAGTTTHAAIAEISFAIGMLAGSVLLGIGGGFKNRGISIAGSVALMGTTLTLSGLLPENGFVVFGILCAIMGMAAPFYTGPQMALMQEKIAPQYLGRVFGLYSSIISFSMPIGLMISGIFADYVGVHNWFLVSGLACIVLAAFTFSMANVRQIDQ